MIFEQSRNPEGLSKAAVRSGQSLSVKQVRAIMKAHSVPIPKTGTGKSGSVRKFDLVKVLVEHFFPDETEMSQSDKARLIKKLSGSIPSEEADLSLMKAVGALDRSEQAHFEPLVKAACDELEEKALQQERRRKPSEKEQGPEDVPAATPRAHRELEIPTDGDLPGRQRRAERVAAAPSSAQRAAPVAVPRTIRDLFPAGTGALFVRYKQDRVTVQFRGLPDLVQRSRTCSFTADASARAKAGMVRDVLSFTHHTYHRHCTGWKDYDAEWQVPSMETIEAVISGL